MIHLISKIFQRSLVVNLLVKFQTELGDPKPLSIWFFWPISIRTKILAPESARIPEHFQCCVILGHPIDMQQLCELTTRLPTHYFLPSEEIEIVRK